MAELLVVRGADLVVLGVVSTGCALGPGVLRATGDGATITVTFPPQSLSETKVAGAFIQGGLLSPPSRITYSLPAGTQVPLDVAGLLRAIRGLPILPGAAQIELPFGLVLSAEAPPAGSVTGAGPDQPVASAGVSGLWQFAVTATGQAGLAVRPTLPTRPLDGDEGSDVHPLDGEQRAQIVATGATAAAERLRLSALGGTLTSRLHTDALRWDHDTALGRDQRVRFEQAGVLYPFGHPATLVETVERRVQDGDAVLHRETVLRVTQPLHQLPADGSRAARAFPFGEVEMLTTTLTGVRLKQHTPFERPPDIRDAMQARRQQINDVELPAAHQSFGELYRQPIPQDEFQLDGSLLDVPAAGSLRDTLRSLGEKEAALAELQALFENPDPENPIPGLFDQIQQVRQEIANLKAEEAFFRAQLAPHLVFLRRIVPTPAESANPLLYVQRLAEAEGDPTAQAIMRLVAEVAELNAKLDGQKPSLISRITLEGSSAEAQLRVRCAGRLGDVVLTTAMLFLHDLRVPGDGFFEGYSSFDDPSLLSGLEAFTCELPGTPVDLVRRPGQARTTDVQEVHALTITAVKPHREVRPTLDTFVIDLPELRSLLPAVKGRVPATLSGEFLNGGSSRDVIRLNPPVDMDFDKNAERGGGLVVPSFSADVVSDDFGPTDLRALPGGGNPLAALSRMKLFGIPLTTLLRQFDVPPAILQFMDGGLPRGVEMSWRQQKLKSTGVFVAHPPEPRDAPDSTTLDLTVRQTLTSRSTDCTLTAFTLRLPTPETEILMLSFGSVAFKEGSGRPPSLDISNFGFTFVGALRLIKDLQEKVTLGGAKPQLDLRKDRVVASYSIRVGDASSGAFLMRNIAVHIQVEIPFRGGAPSVRLAFASREAPFQLSVPPFGGGGYVQIAIEGSTLKELDVSLEFGGVIGVDFGVVEAEVHALGGVRSDLIGSEVQIGGFLRLGGSVSLFGLASVSIELRVELLYDSALNQLAGRATLVIEVDLTLYADSVELDSGLWVFAGGSSPPPPPDLGSPAAQQGWSEYQGAYA